jgi:hypothetical protein
MNTKQILSAVFAGATFASIWSPMPKLFAQVAEGILPAEESPDKKSKDPVELVIDYGGGIETRMPSHRGAIDPVSMRPNRLMPFSLKFPIEKIQMPVAISALDGGEVIPLASVTDIAVTPEGIFTFNYERANAGEFFTDDAGLIRFAFQSSEVPGVYRVVVQLPAEQHILEFHVIPFLSPD